MYWDEWANDIARIAQTHISRITAILDKPDNINEIKAFNSFLKELKDDLNDSITRDEAIEMLAQHIITKPVFDALFEGYSFTSHNPVSKAMQAVLEVLDEHNLDKEAATLEKFYASVKMRAAGISDLKARQKIIVELYDKFFANAFPKTKQTSLASFTHPLKWWTSSFTVSMTYLKASSGRHWVARAFTSLTRLQALARSLQGSCKAA